MLEHLVVPIEWKAEDGEGANTLVGYASTFGNVDLGGDVVVPGAFTKTIKRVKAEGIPLLADHIAMTASVLGTIYDASETSTGLVIKARLSQAPSAQDIAVKLREGHLSKLSIGYETMDESYEDRGGVKVRLLKELKLWETSVVVFPMNPEATISRVKTLVTGIPDAERKSLLDRLVEEEAAHEHKNSEEQTGAGDPPPVGSEDNNASGDEPGAEGGPKTAASDEGAKPGDEPAHWDHYRSEALLAGRDTGDIDAGKRAGLAERLRIQLAEISAEG